MQNLCVGLRALLLLAMGIAPFEVLHAADRRADTIIAKAVDAMGGIEAIHAIHSLVMRGYHYEGAYHQELITQAKSTATMVRLRPNYRLVGCRPEIAGCEGKWGRIVEAFDGVRGWELNWPRQRLVRTVAKAERALRCGAQFDPLFVDYRRRGYRARYLGRTVLLGHAALAVEITPNDGCAVQTYYFDPGNYAWVMTRAALPVHARGAAVDTVNVIRETQRVAGVVLPVRTEEVALADGHVLGGAGWSSIEANTISDPKLFAAPVTHPVGATAVMLEMLAAAARGEAPASMMRRYDAFKTAANAGQDDPYYDLNWLGYELLKVNNYPAALAVFRRMVADYPDKADAYDSIGDAYLQQGEKAQARAAFDRALALDPKLRETARKRASLN